MNQTNRASSVTHPKTPLQEEGNIRMVRTSSLSKKGNTEVQDGLPIKYGNTERSNYNTCTQQELSQCSKTLSSILDMQGFISSFLVVPTGDTLRVYATQYKPGCVHHYNETNCSASTPRKADQSKPFVKCTSVQQFRHIM